MPTIDLTDAELAAVTAVIKRAIEEDRFPRAPRLDPLHSALAKLDATPKPTPDPPLPPQGGKRRPTPTLSRSSSRSPRLDLSCNRPNAGQTVRWLAGRPELRAKV
jgi:hypothetical protein